MSSIVCGNWLITHSSFAAQQRCAFLQVCNAGIIESSNFVIRIDGDIRIALQAMVGQECPTYWKHKK